MVSDRQRHVRDNKYYSRYYNSGICFAGMHTEQEPLRGAVFFLKKSRGAVLFFKKSRGADTRSWEKSRITAERISVATIARITTERISTLKYVMERSVFFKCVTERADIHSRVKSRIVTERISAATNAFSRSGLSHSVEQSHKTEEFPHGAPWQFSAKVIRLTVKMIRNMIRITACKYQ